MSAIPAFHAADWYTPNAGRMAVIPRDQTPTRMDLDTLTGQRVLIDGKHFTVKAVTYVTPSIDAKGKPVPADSFGLIVNPLTCQCTSIIRDDDGRLQCLTHGDVTDIHQTEDRSRDPRGWTTRVD